MSTEDFNPYQAPAAVLEDIPVQASMVLADRGTRFAARLLDGIITGLPSLALSWTIRLALGMGSLRDIARDPRAHALSSCIGITSFAVTFLALNGWLLSRKGQTLGKLICRIRIARRDGSIPRLGESFLLRELALGVIAVLGGLVALWVIYVAKFLDIIGIFGEERRCLHDWLAGTLVLKS